MYEMVGWHHQFNGHESLAQTLRDCEGQGGLACCSPWGCKELDTIEHLSNTNNNPKIHWGQGLWTHSRLSPGGQGCLNLLQERQPLPGPKSGLLSNTQK